MRADTGADVDYVFDYHSFSSDEFAYFVVPRLANSDFTRAIARRGDVIEHTTNGHPGMTRIWAMSAEGLNADFSFTPEFHASSSDTEVYERIGRSYALALYDVIAPALGDFDGDKRLEELDLDILRAAIAAGSQASHFDVNLDGIVDIDDLDFWVVDLAETFVGDANLDGKFGTADVIQVFANGEYEDGIPHNSTWGEGDWNGDDEFTSADLVRAFLSPGYETGYRSEFTPLRPEGDGLAEANAVPEPSSFFLLLFGGLYLKRKP